MTPVAPSDEPEPSAAPAAGEPVLFPEREELGGVRPTVDTLFEQETWTAFGSSYQHCREWAFEQSMRDAVERDLGAALGDLGVEPPQPGHTLRQDGLVVVVATGKLDGFRMRGDMLKLAVCTERPDTGAAATAFISEVVRQLAPPEPLPFADGPNLAWVRQYRGNVAERGVRYPLVDPAATLRWLEQTGFTEVELPTLPWRFFSSDDLAVRLSRDLWLRRVSGDLERLISALP